MHQSTTPSVFPTIWLRWASRQFLNVPTVQTLLPVTFGCSLSSRKTSEAVVLRQLRRWKRLWRGSWTRSHWRTSEGHREVCGAMQQVHCSQRRVLWRGLEFNVCLMKKSGHTKKVWKLIEGTSYLTTQHFLCQQCLFTLQSRVNYEYIHYIVLFHM